MDESTTCQINPITYYILADVHLLNMDELNLHKRAAGQMLPSAFTCSFSITGQEQLNY